MKKLFLLLFTMSLIVSCSKVTSTTSNAFGPYDGQSVYLGNQSSVDAFKEIDAAWAKRDYEALKNLILDLL